MNSTMRLLVALSLLVGQAVPAIAVDQQKRDGVQIAKLPFFGDKEPDGTKDGAEKNGADKTTTRKTDPKSSGKADTDKKESDKKIADRDSDKSDKKVADRKESDKKSADKKDKAVRKAEASDEKRGLFGKKDKKKESQDKKDDGKASAPSAETKSAAQADAKSNAQTDAKAAVDQKDGAPVYIPDASLISVLKDLNKALKDEEQVAKHIEDANQKAVVEAAQALLARALEAAELKSNRIISREEERSIATSLTPEAWASGELKIADDHNGSLVAVWAKRVNGLVNVTVAGRNNKPAPNGKKIGNFIVVVVGRSPIEAGFDIQTQANVNFWLGQLAGITVDSDCITKGEGSDEPRAEKASLSESGDEAVKKNSIVLPILLTERVKLHNERVVAFQEQQRLIARQQEEERKAKEQDPTASAARALAEAAARALAEATLKASGAGAEKTEIAVVPAGGDEAPSIKSDDGDGTDETGPDRTNSERANSERANSERANSERSSDDDRVVTAPPVEGPPVKPASAYTSKGGSRTISIDDVSGNRGAARNRVSDRGRNSDRDRNSNGREPDDLTIATSRIPSSQPIRNQYGWESPAMPSQTRQPSLSATVVLPDRAIAGQFLSAAVVDGGKRGESAVELSFNGATMTTDARGQILYMVPEDATPGRSLNVSLSSRPELSPGIVEILQPLTMPSSRDLPKIDRVSPMITGKSTLIIDGHNFDGNADHNRVLIDGFHEARVIAASPVQIKAVLPAGVNPGQHSICVGNAGMRSNSAMCDVIVAEVKPDPKEANKESLSKLIVKVLGTTNKVQVHVTNNSPEVIKMSRGNELRITTPGGSNNSVIVGVQRLRKGAYDVQASIEQ